MQKESGEGPKPGLASLALRYPDWQSADRLPGSLQELKVSKGGLVSFLFLSSEDNEAIGKELKAAFKLTDLQALKITRRITGRARFFQRPVSLMSAQ